MIREIRQRKKYCEEEMDKARERLRKIQIANKDYNKRYETRGGERIDYYPHKDSNEKFVNLWCDCDLCKKDHDIYFDHCGKWMEANREGFKVLKKLPGYFTFSLRGIGMNRVDCMICGKRGLNHNIAAFVQTKEDGEKITEWFSKYHEQFLDYRSYEPRRIQVKIGACDDHKKILYDTIKKCEFNVISKKMVEEIFDEFENNSG